jgi:hypothetical protein
MSIGATAGLALNVPVSIIASARTDRESKPYDRAAVSNVPAAKHNRHGRRNNQRHAYSMADRQSPLRPSLDSRSLDSRSQGSHSRVRRPGMRHSNRHIPLLRTQYREGEPKESASSVRLPFLSRRNRPRVIDDSFVYDIRIRERFRVLDLAIGAANTAGASYQHNRLHNTPAVCRRQHHRPRKDGHRSFMRSQTATGRRESVN